MKRKLLAWILVLALGLQLLPAVAAEETKAEILLPQTSAELEVGQSMLLSAALSNGQQDAEFTWTSSDPGVATVEGLGLVTAQAVGTARILVRTGSLQAECTVTVTEGQAVPDFQDVPAGAFYATPVDWAVSSGITNGTSLATFAPGAQCTRGQIVTFLWRAAGAPAPQGNTNPFRDVAAGAYYEQPVLWAVEHGITNGMGPDTFAPNQICTRGQVVTFLYRAMGATKVITKRNPFADVASAAFYFCPILWAAENGITNGMTATTFAPQQTCTRGQVVTFLYRTYHPAEPAQTFDPDCYEIVADNCTWLEAKEKALARNGKLVCFDSIEEYRFVLDLIEQKGLNDRYFYLGGTRDALGSDYYWLGRDGLPTQDYLNGGAWCDELWQLGEPNLHWAGSDENALEACFLPAEGRWVWYDYSSTMTSPNRQYAYVIEYDTPLQKPNREETVWSITDLTVQGTDVLVTLNSNGPATLTLQVLDEDREVLQVSQCPAPDYAQAEGITLRLSSLPQYFILRATLTDAEGELLCDPYETIRYTQIWQDYQAQDVDSFDPDRVVNFDASTTTNFGVLADDVLLLDGPGCALHGTYSAVSVWENGHLRTDDQGITGYRVDSPDSAWLGLQQGDKVAATDIEGKLQLFRVGSLEWDGEHLDITPMGDGALWDYYSYMDADMTFGGSDKRVDTEGSSETSFNASLYFNLPKGLKAGAALTASYTVTVGLHWDIKIFGEDYVEFSMKTEQKVEGKFEVVGSADQLNIGADGEKSNSADLIPLGSHTMPTKIPGLTITGKASIPVTLTATATAGASFTRTKTSGFIYIRNVGTQNIDEKPEEGSKSFYLNGELSVSLGIKLDISLAYLTDVAKATVSAEAGIRLKMAMAGDLVSVDHAEKKHCCNLCVSGTLEFYLTVGVSLEFKILEIAEFKPLDAQILNITFPFNPFGDDELDDDGLMEGGVAPGERSREDFTTGGGSGEDAFFHFSLVNEPDSPYGGVPHFGFGPCQNYTYRVTLRCADYQGKELSGIPVQVTGKKGNLPQTNTAPYELYLPVGKYNAAPTIEGSLHPGKAFTVKKTASNVWMECFGPLKVTVLDFDTKKPIPGATVNITHVLSGYTDSAVGGTFLGTATLKNVPAGQVQVDVSAENYAPASEYRVVKANGGTKTTIWLRPLNGTVYGMLQDATTKQFIHGAKLTVTANGRTLSAVSQSTGYFRVEKIPVGARELVITAEGYDGKTVSFTLTLDNRDMDLGTIQLTRSWESYYRNILRTSSDTKYGSNIMLADLDFDGIPELLVGGRPGSGLFSTMLALYTYKNGQGKDISPASNDYQYVPLTDITLSRRAGTWRLTAEYTFRAGHGSYSDGFHQINFVNSRFSTTSLLQKVVEGNTTTYYSGSTKISASAYNTAYNNRFSGWEISKNYVTPSAMYAKRPTNAQITELFTQYTWTGSF